MAVSKALSTLRGTGSSNPSSSTAESFIGGEREYGTPRRSGAQKCRLGLVVCTIGLVRGRAKVGLAKPRLQLYPAGITRAADLAGSRGRTGLLIDVLPNTVFLHPSQCSQAVFDASSRDSGNSSNQSHAHVDG